MRWQRWLRLLVAAIGLGTAVVIYLNSRHQPVPPAPLASQPANPKATIQGGPGKKVRVVAGEEKGSVSWETYALYGDGRTRLGGAHIISTGDDGMEVWADVLEARDQPAQGDNIGVADLTGHVRFKTPKGLDASCDAGTYDNVRGLMTVPGAFRFTRNRVSGEGEGATYDRTNDVLHVMNKSHVMMAADPSGAGVVDATSVMLTMARPEKTLHLDGSARIVHDGDTLSGDNATLLMTDDEKSLRAIELRTHAAVVPGPPGTAARPPEMHAIDIDLAFHPDGHTVQHAVLVGRPSTLASLVLTDAAGRRSITGSRIESDLAPDGQTLTRLVAQAPVTAQLPKTATAPSARTIQAATLSAQGTEAAGLTAAQFDGGVTYIEASASGAAGGGRRVTSRTLVVSLKGQLDAISDAHFSQSVKFADLDSHASAEADLADYEATQNMLHLKTGVGASPRIPHADNGSLEVNARTIDLNTATNDLDAIGNVTTRSKPSASPAGKKPSGLFDGAREIRGSGAELHAKGSQSVFVGGANGTAKIEQDGTDPGTGGSSVAGDQVSVNSDTNNLMARQHVIARFLLSAGGPPAKGAAPPKPDRYTITADALDYTDASRQAIFTGAPASMKSDQGTTSAPKLDMTLAADSHAIEKLIGTAEAGSGGVMLDDATRRGEGDRLEYQAATDGYVLDGSPTAKMRLPDNSGPLCTVSSGPRLIFGRLAGSASGSMRSVSGQPCTGPIK